MAYKYESFTVTGSANSTVYDIGITSTEEEPKHIESILVNVSGYAGNFIEGWVETERVLEIPDYIVDTDADTGSAVLPYSTYKLIEIPLDMDLPVGQTFKVAIRCGGTAKNLRGAYKYTVTS